MGSAKISRNTKHLVTSTGVVAMFMAAAMAMQFVSQSLTAKYFGAKTATDTYMTALNISYYVGKLFLSGQLLIVFTPIFLERRKLDGDDGAWAASANLFNVIALGSGLILAVAILLSPQLVDYIAPKFSGAARRETAEYLRMLLPVSFFMLLSGLGASIMNSLRRFSLPAALGLTTPLALVFSMLLFARGAGVRCLVWANLAAAVFNFTVYYASLARKGLRPKLSFSIKEPATAQTLRLLAPLLFNYFFVELVNSIYRIHMATGLAEGTVSIFNYSNNLYLGLLSILMLPIVTVVFPPLSERIVAGDIAESSELIKRSVRIITLTVLPVSLALAALSGPFITLMYERGEFTAEASRKTAQMLFYLSLAIYPTTVSQLLYRVFFALKRTFVLVCIIIASTIGQIVFLYFFVKWFGYLGLALGPSISVFLLTIMYFIALNRAIPGIGGVYIDPRTLAGIAASCITAAAVYFLWLGIISFHPDPRGLTLLALLAACGAFTLAAQFSLIKLFRLADLDFLFQMVRSRLSSEKPRA